MNDWTWQVGSLKGFGRRLWQQKDDQIRYITEFGFAPTGQCMMSRDMTIELMDGEQQFSAKELVIVGRDPKPELRKDLDRMYAPGPKILLGNGRIPPMGPKGLIQP